MKSLHNPGPRTSPAELVGRLVELAIVLTEAIDRGLAEQGLTRARAEVIWRLGRQGPMTQRELSQALRCTPRNVTGLVDALEGAELVARNPHPTDRRATLVSLTDTGRGVASDWQAAAQGLGERIFEGLASTEPSRFVTTLEFVMARLRDQEVGQEAHR